MTAKLKFDKAHEEISKIIPQIRIARKNKKDFDMEKFSWAILKLVSYLKDSIEYGKVEILNDMIDQSETKQLIFGTNYKIYKDLSIEIPFNFDTDVLDQFFQEVYFE